jgi:hypothetical protein
MTYDFQAQLNEGEKGFAMFVEFLERDYPKVQVQKAEMREDLAGVDATLVFPRGEVWKVQVKTDWKAAQTGNVFLETISDERRGAQGLLYKGNPTHLVIVIPDEQMCYIAEMPRVREIFQREWWKLPRRPVENKTWVTLGICVPRNSFEQHTKAMTYDMRKLTNE